MDEILVLIAQKKAKLDNLINNLSSKEVMDLYLLERYAALVKMDNEARAYKKIEAKIEEEHPGLLLKEAPKPLVID